MGFRSGVFRTLFRNLGWAGLALAALCWGLGAVEVLSFLHAVPGAGFGRGGGLLGVLPPAQGLGVGQAQGPDALLGQGTGG